MDELFALFYSGQLIWISSFGFYIYDSAHRVGTDLIVIHRTLKGEWKALLPILPMQPPGRRFGILPLATPFLPAVRVRQNNSAPAVSQRRIRQLLAPTEALRAVSGLAWILLFVFGPIMTATLGLHRTLLFVVPSFLYCIVCIFCILAYNRRQLRFTWTTVFAITLEALICPGMAPNSYRRVVLRQRSMAGDVFAFLATSDAGRVSADRLTEEVFPDDPGRSGTKGPASPR